MFNPKSNKYSGTNEGDYVALLNGLPFDPEPSLKVRNHSPTGFAWGYGGSGPAQLALAILMEEFDAEIAQRYYMDFKFKVIAGLPNKEGDTWELTSNDVYHWVSTHLQQRLAHWKGEMQKLGGNGERLTGANAETWREAHHKWQDTLREVNEVLGTRFEGVS